MPNYRVRFVCDYDEVVEAEDEEDAEAQVFDELMNRGHLTATVEEVEMEVEQC